MANRILVFSDVQGNSIALEAMFDRIKNLADFDTLDFICLGDVASAYAPNAVIDLLREYDVTCIKGNMDDVILEPKHYKGDNENEAHYSEMDIWASEQLTAINRQYLEDCPAFITDERFGETYCFTHGISTDYNVAIHAQTAQQLLTVYFDLGISVMFTGHTHQQFMLPVDDKIMINPGSIGFPDPQSNGKRPLRAQFTIIDEGRFEFCSVDYKREDFNFAVLNSGMPHAVWYLEHWDI